MTSQIWVGHDEPAHLKSSHAIVRDDKLIWEADPPEKFSVKKFAAQLDYQNLPPNMQPQDYGTKDYPGLTPRMNQISSSRIRTYDQSVNSRPLNR
ncbi:hypothetical protein COLO4_19556 [Corchorus olitorius]|uniref:Uncharacterized protein n=1 Tax=Corchorus olitorius TaxID=93759 RepID=A0A1R3J4W3_9ROSI|nr:hypothetical protein COLO4_19556 [Corchorus olitorius]